MLHFFMQAINPARPLLLRLKNWGQTAHDLRERPRKRPLQMEALRLEFVSHDLSYRERPGALYTKIGIPHISGLNPVIGVKGHAAYEGEGTSP